MSVTPIVELAEAGLVSQYAATSLASDLLSSCVEILDNTVLDPSVCRLIITGDFDDSVKSRLPADLAAQYSSDRGAGTVAGRTMYTNGHIDVLMPAGLFTNHAADDLQSYPCQLIRRTTEHEGLHARLKQMGESSLEPPLATHSPSVFLTEVARSVVEEYRVEAAIDPASYPLLAPAGTGGALANLAYRLAVVALDEYQRHLSVNRLWVGVLSACRDLWTRLGYVAAAQTFSQAGLRPSDHYEQHLWEQMVAPCWSDFTRALGAVAPARQASAADRRVLAESQVQQLLNDWLPLLGFELNSGPLGEAFYINDADLVAGRAATAASEH